MNIKRTILIGLKMVAIAVAIKAYQEPDSFYFTHRMALYCFIMCLLTTYYSWSDKVSRILMVSLTGLAANNLYDEQLGDHLTFGLNEYIFGILIAVNFIYQSFRLWKQAATK